MVLKAISDQFYRFLLDLILPKYCLSCYKLGPYMCAECIKTKLDFMDLECHVCRKKVMRSYYVHDLCRENSTLDGVFVLYRYNDLIKRLVGEYKYNGYFAISKTIADMFMSYGKFPSANLMIPVPLHIRKEKKRGFNQSTLIIEKVSKSINIKYSPVIRRVKNTKSQMKLSRIDRLNNLNDAFAIDTTYKIKGKDILIIDDIMTTGTTLEACAKILKQNGAHNVFGLVLARR